MRKQVLGGGGECVELDPISERMIAASALGRERRAGPGANQSVLVLRRAVDHDPHEERRRASRHRGAHHAGARPRRGTLDLSR
jgi:hypothetical protein